MPEVELNDRKESKSPGGVAVALLNAYVFNSLPLDFSFDGL